MQHSFGRQLSHHKGTFSSGGWLWYVGGILLLSFFANLGRGDWILALGSLIGAALFLIVPVLRWRQDLEVFEGGFVWRRLTGATTIRREEVRLAKHITHHDRMGTSIEVSIELVDGDELSVVGVSDPEQLFNTLNVWASSEVPDSDSQTQGTASEGWKPPAGGWRPPTAGGTP